MTRCFRRFLPLSKTLVLLFLILSITNNAMAEDWSVSLYSGRLTLNTWEKSISPDVTFADVGLIVLSGSWTFARTFENKLSFELEANLVRHFRDQDHWEINLPIVAFRWHPFPWDRYVDTSFAWGLGSSYATEIPAIENKMNQTSKQWLIYWFGEFTFGLPGEPWEIMTRLHHRSDCFGALNGGGSNALCLGLRYRF